MQCNNWNDNRELFGCNNKNIKPELDSLCRNAKISAGGSLRPHIYIFKNKKYFLFDNKPKVNKPFGELVSGNLVTVTRFEGMHTPGGVSHTGNDDALVIVYNTKWAQWATPAPTAGTAGTAGTNASPGTATISGTATIPKSIDVSEQPIGLEESELNGNDTDLGALIPIDLKIWKFAKIIETNVCYVVIENDKCFWDQKCKPVNEDQNQFPANIVGAVKTSKNLWYYFDRNGKYCVRPNGHNNPVNYR